MVSLQSSGFGLLGASPGRSTGISPRKTSWWLNTFAVWRRRPSRRGIGSKPTIRQIPLPSSGVA